MLIANYLETVFITNASLFTQLLLHFFTNKLCALMFL